MMTNTAEADPTKMQVAPTSSDMTPTEAIHTVMRLWRTMLYRKKVVLGSLAVCVALGIAYYATAPRYYQSTAKLLIVERKADELTSMGEQIANENLMATQRDLMTSQRVVQDTLDNLPAEFQVDLVNTPHRKWVESIKDHLSVKASRQGSSLQVSYQSLSPEAAAAVVSGLVASYLDFVGETHKGSAGDTIEVLNSRLSQVEADLTQNQQSLLNLRARVGHLALGEEQDAIDPTVQRALRLNESWIEANDKRIDLQARLAAVESSIVAGHGLRQHLMALQESLGQQMLASSLGLSPEDLTAIREREGELIEANQKLESYSPYLGPNNPKMLELHVKIAGLEKYLANYRANAGKQMAGLTNDDLAPMLRTMLTQAIDQAWQQERQKGAAFEAARNEAARHSSDLMDLKTQQREVVRLEDQRDELISRINTTDIFQSQGPIQAVVTADPLPSEKPVSPRLKTIGALSLICGLFIGCVLAYVQDVLDDRFNSPEELSQQLGVPVLALVERLAPLPGEGLASLHAHMQPTATCSEAFRTLRTSLSLNAEMSDRLLISSTEPGDGKTTVSANLAVAFAQAGKRTLIIDADLRRPGMTALLGLKGVPGVVDLLSSEQSPVELAPQFVQKTDAPGLDVLPAGLRRPNPAELLSSSEFVELLAWADSQYDQVLVDCPPVLAVSDAQIVGRLVDGAILVVRPEKNHRRLVARACEQFHTTGTQLLGVVANDVSEFSGAGYGYGYGYSYGGDEEEDDQLESVTLPASELSTSQAA